MNQPVRAGYVTWIRSPGAWGCGAQHELALNRPAPLQQRRVPLSTGHLGALALMTVYFRLRRRTVWIRTIQPDAFRVARFVDLSAYDVPTLAQVHNAAVQLSCPALRRYPHPIVLSHFSLSLNQPSSREQRVPPPIGALEMARAGSTVKSHRFGPRSHLVMRTRARGRPR